MWERVSGFQAPCDALASKRSSQRLRDPQQSFGVLCRQRLVTRLFMVENGEEVAHVDRLLAGSARVEVPRLVSQLSALARSRNLVAHDVLTRGA